MNAADATDTIQPDEHDVESPVQEAREEDFADLSEVAEPPPYREPQARPAAPPPLSAATSSPAPEPVPVSSDSPFVKSPTVAAVLGLFPGLGHVYDGLYARGVGFFFLVALCINLAAQVGEPIFGFLIPFLWLFSIMDAFRQANLINHGYATDLGATGPLPKIRPGQGTLAVGVVFMLVGSLELGDRLGYLAWERVLDAWPVGFLLIGLWMVISAVRQQLREKQAEQSY